MDGGAIPEWAAPEDAWIRPGVPIGNTTFASFLAPGGSCTANFIFTNPSRQALYVGTAAHCFLDDMPLGGNVSVGYVGKTVQATLAYSSWRAMNVTWDQQEETCISDDLDIVDDPVCWNDFALLEIGKADWGHAHPAVLVYGEPAGLGPTPAVGSLVLTYGSSHYREALGEAADARSGPVLESIDHRFVFHTGIPSTPGDSGGPVLDSNLHAVGVVVYLYIRFLPPASNGAASLAWLLDQAEQAGFAVELASV